MLKALIINRARPAIKYRFWLDFLRGFTGLTVASLLAQRHWKHRPGYGSPQTGLYT